MMRWLIGAPLLVLLVLFALSNATPVRLGLWPTDLSIELPLSFAILGGMGIAFLLGGSLVWGSALAARRRARRSEAGVQALTAQIERLRARLAEAAPTPMPPPS